jgi:catechol 2,3-dioxygenase-like lactoylglutathione lyase family enzyme
MCHLHLLVKDLEASKKFWIVLGASPVKLGPAEAMELPDVLVLLRTGEPSGGTVASIVDHVGFKVPNVSDAMSKWKAAGLTTEAGRSPTQGYVITPEMVRLEIIEDATLNVPIVFHHIHFFVGETGAGGVVQIQSWYSKVFDAKSGKRGQDDADDLPGVNLTFRKSETTTAGTQGRALDHIGFEVKNLEAFCNRAEANGVKFDRTFTKNPELGIFAGIFD